METAGVDPAPPRCKRGVLPPERPLDRCGRMESNHHSLRLRGYNPASSPVLSVRLEEVADRIRTDTSGITTPGACRYTTATMDSRFPDASLRARMRVAQCWPHGPLAGGCAAARGGAREPGPPRAGGAPRPGGEGARPAREARRGRPDSNRRRLA